MEEEVFKQQNTEIECVRDILLEVADKGEIKYKPQYIKKASDKTLESIY